MGARGATGYAGCRDDAAREVGERNLLLARVAGSTMPRRTLPHLKAQLTRGQLVGQVVTCPGHGSQLTWSTGACVAG